MNEKVNHNEKKVNKKMVLSPVQWTLSETEQKWVEAGKKEDMKRSPS